MVKVEVDDKELLLAIDLESEAKLLTGKRPIKRAMELLYF